MTSREEFLALATAIDKLLLAEGRAYRKFDQYLRTGNVDAGGYLTALSELINARTTTTLAIIAAGTRWPEDPEPDPQTELTLEDPS